VHRGTRIVKGKQGKWALAIAAGLASPWANGARAAEPSYDDLRQQVQQLQSRLDALETKQNAPTTAEVDRTVRGVIADADRRSQLLSSGDVTAGYDKKGAFVRSADGNFLFRPTVQLQFRYVNNYNDAADDPSEDGFEVRQLRLRFDGNVISPDLTYSFMWDTNRSGGAVVLLDAWTQYRFAPQWAVKLGQFKESVFHEKDIGDYAALAVERSLADAVLGGNRTDRVQGVSLIYGGTKDNAFRAEVAFHDGANSKNTDFRDTNGQHWGTGARAEYKFVGNWDDYKDFTAKGSKENLLVAGAGVDYTESDGGGTALPTADVQFETPNGLTLYGAVHGGYTNTRGDVDDESFDWGALAQVGYLLTDQLELFGRYDIVHLDSANANGDNFNEITVGLNYYLGDHGSALHRAKVTIDATYLPDGAPSNQTQAGVLAGDDDQFVFRAQFQLLI
jgi:hypothetical protein